MTAYWPLRVQVLVGLVGVALIALGFYLSRRDGK